MNFFYKFFFKYVVPKKYQKYKGFGDLKHFISDFLLFTRVIIFKCFTMSVAYTEIPSRNDYGPNAALAQTLTVLVMSCLLLNSSMGLFMQTLVLGDVYLNKNGAFSLTSTQASWFGGLIPLCYLPGSLLTGFLQDKIGRKYCMILANMPSFIGWLMLHLAVSPTMLFIFSMATGFSIGFVCTPVFSYIGEVTEPRVRGQLASISQGGFMIGSLVTSILGYFFKWRTVAFISSIIPIISIILVFLIPESPIWLLSRGKSVDAMKSLCWLRGWVEPREVKQEYEELVQYNKISGVHVANNSKKNVKFTSNKLSIKDPLIYRPLRLISVFFLVSIILSIIPCKPYLEHILTELGLKTNQSLILILLSFLQIFPCVMTSMVVKGHGKRFLTLLSVFANTTAVLIIGIYLILIKNQLLINVPWIFLFLFCWIYFFAYVLTCLPWIVLSEIYPNKARGIATGTSAAIYYLLTFILVKEYLSIEEYLSLEYTMISFGIIGIIGFIYLFLYLPETEHKTLLEIEEIFDSNKRVHILAVIAPTFQIINIGIMLFMPTIVISDFYQHENDDFSLTSNQLSWYASIICIYQLPGSLVSGFLQDKYGRKRCMILANIPSLIGWALLHYTTTPTMLLLSSLPLGLSIGISEAPVFSYIGEIAEPRNRGQLSSIANSGLMLGSVLGSILGCFFKWRTIALFIMLSPIICVCLILIIPESPIWLLSNGQTDKAKKSLCWLRGWVELPEVNEEYEELVQYIQLSGTHIREGSEKKTKLNFMKMIFKDPLVYRPLSMLLLFFFFSEILCIIPCRPFIKHLLTEVGLETYQSEILILLAVIQFVPCVVLILIVHRYGKRFLSLLSLTANTGGVLFIGLYLMLIKNEYLTCKPWIFLLLFCWIYFFAYILTLLPWMVISEIFPNNIRGVTTGLSAAFYYLYIFFSTYLYTSIESYLSLEYTMILFGVIGIVGILFLYVYLPETENKTLLEIEEIFESNKSVYQ
ncbi:uncharacterized protein LOC126901007 [Daktulosphaira vitifoliae]|uniref:uncharacterized protein LOC126901007 n=1 Tax=Daktulosphaira vitifoliae TaxID=58002 RepID=UPI0021AA57D5|nr:uncharacterized protein LOC126901007 [Daktulosphaira vitifoliae]